MKPYFLFACLVLSICVFAQNPYQNLLKEGNARKVITSSKDSLGEQDAYFRLLAHLYLNDTKSAEEILVSKYQPTHPVLAYVLNYKYLYSYDYDYCLALYHKLTGDILKSNEHFKVYRDKLSDNEAKQMIDFYIHQNENTKVYSNYDSKFIAPASKLINSNYDEHSPVFIDNHLMFSSNYNHSTQTALNIENAYSSDFHNNGKLLFPKLSKVEHSIQTELTDGSVILYVQKKDNKGDFYLSQKNALGYVKPIKIKGAINSKSLELSASFSKKDSLLYFSSNRPGGFGGMDLYSSKLNKDGTWSIPRNLGPSINTSYNEDAPYFDESDDVLYFSSNGDRSIGGYDFFKTEFGEDSIKSVYNLGAPINSSFDDIFITRAGKDFYFSSNRNPELGMDIFKLSTSKISNQIYAWHLTEFPDTLSSEIELSSCFEFNVEQPHKREASKIYNWIFNQNDTITARSAKYCFEDKSKTNVQLLSITGKYGFTNIEKNFDVDLSNFKLEIEQEGEQIKVKSSEPVNINQYYWKCANNVYSSPTIDANEQLEFAVFSIIYQGENYFLKVQP